MRVKRNKIRRRQLDDNKKKSFFASQTTEEKSPFFSGSETVQRKIIIGKSGDPQEKEAEAAAKQVVNQPVQKAEKKEEEPVKKADKKEEEPVKKAAAKEEEPVKKAEKEEEPVQKAEAKDEEPVKKAEKKEEEPVQKADKKEEEKPVQTKADPTALRTAAKEEREKGNNTSYPGFEERLAKQKGRGFVLPDDIRIEMEKKFNSNFRKVRIHTDKEAELMCEQIHALAFAHGHDIYCNAGQYNPNGAEGKELLAHELAHVVQNG